MTTADTPEYTTFDEAVEAAQDALVQEDLDPTDPHTSALAQAVVKQLQSKGLLLTDDQAKRRLLAAMENYGAGYKQGQRDSAA